MFVWCTNRSLPPPSAAMKPNPFSSLNHLTVPVGMKPVLLGLPATPEDVQPLPRGLQLHLAVPRRPLSAQTVSRSDDVILSAMDDPMQLGRGVTLPLSEVTIRTSRSSGPGGQHANVTASRIEGSFDVRASEALSDSQKRRTGGR